MPVALLITPSQRFHNEVHVYNLHHRGVDVVPLVGVYSTESHPFGPVYECVGNFDLRQYLRSEPNVDRLKLVLIHIPTYLLSVTPLTLLVNS